MFTVDFIIKLETTVNRRANPSGVQTFRKVNDKLLKYWIINLKFKIYIKLLNKNNTPINDMHEYKNGKW